jgi:hypothetical protein
MNEALRPIVERSKRRHQRADGGVDGRRNNAEAEMDPELRQQPTTNESAYDSMRRSPTTAKPVPCNSTLEFRCHPERDNNNRQEDHQNCAHDIPCLFSFVRAAGQRQKTPKRYPRVPNHRFARWMLRLRPSPPQPRQWFSPVCLSSIARCLGNVRASAKSAFAISSSSFWFP